MTIESDVFKRYSPDFKKLKEYGFKLSKGNYIIEKIFDDGNFKASVKVFKSGEVKGDVFDNESGEIFLPLRLNGAFAASVRAGYEQILMDIRENCFLKNFFVSAQANRIAEFVYKKYSDIPVFMWKEYPTFGVFKNPDSDKWYGLIMNILRAKLENGLSGSVDVLNIKIDKDVIPELLKKDGFFPAYHMKQQ